MKQSRYMSKYSETSILLTCIYLVNLHFFTVWKFWSIFGCLSKLKQFKQGVEYSYYYDKEIPIFFCLDVKDKAQFLKRKIGVDKQFHSWMQKYALNGKNLDLKIYILLTYCIKIIYIYDIKDTCNLAFSLLISLFFFLRIL